MTLVISFFHWALVLHGQLVALLQRRADYPYRHDWALPGGFIGMEEGLDHAARRLLADKGGLPSGKADAWLEQLHTFGEPGRDPRMRVISVAYFALLPAGTLLSAVAGRADLMLAPIILPREEKGARALGGDGLALPLAFDHAGILSHAVRHLRGKLDTTQIALAVLPPHFTLRDLQTVHEAILGNRLNKPAFRRRMLDTGWIRGTGIRESGTSYRPAELYRRVAGDQTADLHGFLTEKVRQYDEI